MGFAALILSVFGLLAALAGNIILAGLFITVAMFFVAFSGPPPPGD